MTDDTANLNLNALNCQTDAPNGDGAAPLGYRVISGRFPQNARFQETWNEKRIAWAKRAEPDRRIRNAKKAAARYAAKKARYETLNAGERAALHVSEKDVTFHSTVKIYANAVEVKKIKHDKQQPSPKHQRGAIVRFSSRSRSRMMRRTGQVRGMKKPYFITLTYPGEFVADPQRVKEHLSMLKKRLKREFNRPGMIWRLELKKRLTGASQGEIVPHYHLILWGMSIYEKEMHETINKMWWEIVWESQKTGVYYCNKHLWTREQIDHGSHGVKVEQLNDFSHALLYVSKYAAKVEDDETSSDWGRRWGVCLYADTGHSIEIELTWTQHMSLRRELRRLLERRRSQYAWWLKSAYADLGYTVLGVGDKDHDASDIASYLAKRIVAHTKGYEI